jgi:putative transcriptional regulator
MVTGTPRECTAFRADVRLPRGGYDACVDSLRGQLLIAPPHLTDPNFSRTVVLMVQHDREGALGLVLNRPTGRSIDELWQELRQRSCRRRDPVYLGGPVPGPLMVLHGDPLSSDVEILDGVYCCSSDASLERLVEEVEAPLRAYAGYSGWGTGQLEMELQLGSWLSAPALAEHVFHTPTRDLWQRVFREIADDTSLPDGFAPRADDPSLN